MSLTPLEAEAHGEEGAVFESELRAFEVSGRIAYRLATLLENRGDENERVLWLAVRATRFGVGEDAIALRNRVRARF